MRVATLAELNASGESLNPRIPLNPHNPVLQAVENIFWETASIREFATPAEKEAFRYRYVEYYWRHAGEWFFVALPSDAGSELPVGYLCAVPDTIAHQALFDIAPHIPLFHDLYQEYPAHLHINLTAAARGKGVGSQLIQEFVTRLSRNGVPGVHLVTSTDQENRWFYRKNHFTHEIARGEGAVQALFMGRKLDHTI